MMGVRTCRRCGCTDHDCRDCIARTGEPCCWVAADLCSACSNLTLPDEMTPAMADVLGMPALRCSTVAQMYRDAGVPVEHSLEAEQAFVLARFLPLAILHGARWRHYALADLDAADVAAQARAPSARVEVDAG